MAIDVQEALADALFHPFWVVVCSNFACWECGQIFVMNCSVLDYEGMDVPLFLRSRTKKKYYI